MGSFTSTLTLLFCSLLFIPNILYSKDINKAPNNYRNLSGWSTSVQAASVYQFATDLDKGGRYRNARYKIQASRNYLWDPQSSASLALSYVYSDYHFSAGGTGSLAESSPWGQVHSLTLSAPLRKGFNERWSGFLLPSMRFSGESDASFNKSISAAMFAAATYRFSNHLSVGPGFGVSSQLQDSTTVYPLLIVRWNISEQLRFNLGSGSGMSQGPGLTLSYQANPQWKYSVGGYYEKNRFRLNKRGDIAGGVAEDSSFPVLATATYNVNPGIRVTLMAGLELAGELSVENSDGDTVIDDSSDPGLIAGISFDMRL